MPEIGEILKTRLEPENVVTYSRKKGQIVGDLIKGSSGRFAKTIFHFLCVMCEPWKYMPS